MSLAVSNKIDEKSISWNSESILNNNSAWSIISGVATLGSKITLGSGAEISLTLDLSGKEYKGNYLKLITHLTCDDTTLSTDNVHNVCVICEVNYLVETDGKKEEELVMYEYYPKYDFEESYNKDYTIVQALNSKIKSINVSIVNYESVPVEITGTGLYISYVIDEGTVQTVVNNTINSYTNQRASCIDVLSADPNPSTVPNGINAPYCYMWILRSALE
jgi:hypothetical protein